MNVLIMPSRLVHLALFPITTSPLVGFVIALIPLPVLVIVTTLVKSWKKCVALELKQHRYLRTGVSAVFIIGFFVSLTHAICITCGFALSSLSRGSILLFRRSNGKPNFECPLVRRVLVKVSHTTCGILSWNSCFTGRLAAPSNPLLLKLTPLRLHPRVIFALDVLCYKDGAHDSA